MIQRCATKMDLSKLGLCGKVLLSTRVYTPPFVHGSVTTPPPPSLSTTCPLFRICLLHVRSSIISSGLPRIFRCARTTDERNSSASHLHPPPRKTSPVDMKRCALHVENTALPGWFFGYEGVRGGGLQTDTKYISIDGMDMMGRTGRVG